ncbi:cold shock domain-containing protein [Actinoallomurus sp. NPDC050550]|uniref:cold shock domain-containing protein n=1 Tax=Actinoallomurus sp. NPDC050550 TaxID=3154937 RepID=UPI0033CC93C0
MLASPEVPGEVWAHFSSIRLPDPDAYRALNAREPVVFTWEEADQDGYAFRAVEVRPASDVTDSTVWGQD